MAGSLFIAFVLITGFVVVVAMNAHGKARAFRKCDDESGGPRPPEAVTGIELPAPQFNKRDRDQRRGKFS